MVWETVIRTLWIPATPSYQFRLQETCGHPLSFPSDAVLVANGAFVTRAMGSQGKVSRTLRSDPVFGDLRDLWCGSNQRRSHPSSFTPAPCPCPPGTAPSPGNSRWTLTLRSSSKARVAGVAGDTADPKLPAPATGGAMATGAGGAAIAAATTRWILSCPTSWSHLQAVADVGDSQFPGRTPSPF